LSVERRLTLAEKLFGGEDRGRDSVQTGRSLLGEVLGERGRQREVHNKKRFKTMKKKLKEEREENIKTPESGRQEYIRTYSHRLNSEYR
jgi:hypothetical protein